MKKVIHFLSLGWVNLLAGFLILLGSLFVFLRFRPEPDLPSLFLGFSLFVSTDIMGYGLSRFFKSKKATKTLY